ncbi:MAG: T9SS type A sorting domain-containing protein [Marinoscillum sp.]|uniref:T9SS type A sorting domain-containing protein n=1 Tax=Marinoscillum sp. TaxID=2024838 RepID=UPI0032F889BA
MKPTCTLLTSICVLCSFLFTSAQGIDPDFKVKTRGKNHFWKVTPLVNGKILIRGSFHEINGLSSSHIVSINTDGSLDDANWYKGDKPLTKPAVGLESNGSVVVFLNYSDKVESIIMCSSTGEKLWEYALNDYVRDTYLLNGIIGRYIVTPDSSVYISARIVEIEGHQTNGVFKLTKDGTLDKSFSANVSATPHILLFHNETKKLLFKGNSGNYISLSETGNLLNQFTLPNSNLVKADEDGIWYISSDESSSRISVYDYEESTLKHSLNSFIGMYEMKAINDDFLVYTLQSEIHQFDLKKNSDKIIGRVDENSYDQLVFTGHNGLILSGGFHFITSGEDLYWQNPIETEGFAWFNLDESGSRTLTETGLNFQSLKPAHFIFEDESMVTLGLFNRSANNLDMMEIGYDGNEEIIKLNIPIKYDPGDYNEENLISLGDSLYGIRVDFAHNSPVNTFLFTKNFDEVGIYELLGEEFDNFILSNSAYDNVNGRQYFFGYFVQAGNNYQALILDSDGNVIKRASDLLEIPSGLSGAGNLEISNGLIYSTGLFNNQKSGLLISDLNLEEQEVITLNEGGWIEKGQGLLKLSDQSVIVAGNSSYYGEPEEVAVLKKYNGREPVDTFNPDLFNQPMIKKPLFLGMAEYQDWLIIAAYFYDYDNSIYPDLKFRVLDLETGAFVKDLDIGIHQDSKITGIQTYDDALYINGHIINEDGQEFSSMRYWFIDLFEKLPVLDYELSADNLLLGESFTLRNLSNDGLKIDLESNETYLEIDKSYEITPTVSGLNTYHITGFNRYGTIQSEFSVYVHEAKVVLSVTDNEMITYPNPADDHILFTELIIPSSVEMYDFAGRELHISLDRERYSIDISHLKKGIYLLKTRTQDGQLIQSKIIKK